MYEMSLFDREIVEALEENFPEGTEITMQTIVKPGNKEYVGIVVKDPKVNITPTIYLWDGYENEPVDEVVERVLNMYDNYKTENNIDVSFITNWDEVKEKILIKLMNPETNEKYLKELVTVPYLDLVAVFYIPVITGENGSGNVTVQKNFLDIWDVTAEEVFAVAVENTRETLYIEDLAAIMKKLMGGNIPEEMMVGEPLMIVLSNKNKINGAGVLPSALTEINKRYGKCYLIPSSVHEMIILPDNGTLNKDEINSMIREVNETEILPEERLSDHAYYFDGKELKIA